MAKKRKIDGWTAVIQQVPEIKDYLDSSPVLRLGDIDVLDLIQLSDESRSTIFKAARVNDELQAKVMAVMLSKKKMTLEFNMGSIDNKSVFYVFDTHRPTYLETNCPFIAKDISEIPVNDLPPELYPVGLKFDLFAANVDGADCYKRYEWLEGPTNHKIFVFTWKKSISAREKASQYFRDIRFHEIQVPVAEDNELRRYKPLCDLLNSPIFVVNVSFWKVCRSVVTSSEEEELKQVQQRLRENKCLQLQPVENQLSSLLADVIRTKFTEFSVSTENEDNDGSLVYNFTPFYRSRRGFAIFRRKKLDGQRDDAAQIFIQADDKFESEFEALTIEAKKQSNDTDKYQLLAGMEITACQIATRRLRNGEKISTIKIVGVLLDYTNQEGRIMSLVMDFQNRISHVNVASNTVTASQAFHFALNSI